MHDYSACPIVRVKLTVVPFTKLRAFLRVCDPATNGLHSGDHERFARITGALGYCDRQ